MSEILIRIDKKLPASLLMSFHPFDRKNQADYGEHDSHWEGMCSDWKFLLGKC